MNPNNVKTIIRSVGIALLLVLMYFVYSYGGDWFYSIVSPSSHPKFQWSMDYLMMAKGIKEDHKYISDIRFYNGGSGIQVKCWLNPRCTYKDAYLIFEDLKTILDDEDFVAEELCHNAIPGNSFRYEIQFMNQSFDNILYRATSRYKTKKIDGEKQYVMTDEWVFVDYTTVN